MDESLIEMGNLLFEATKRMLSREDSGELGSKISLLSYEMSKKNLQENEK